jgi:hypothetical protein
MAFEEEAYCTIGKQTGSHLIALSYESLPQRGLVMQQSIHSHAMAFALVMILGITSSLAQNQDPVGLTPTPEDAANV